MEPPPDPPSTDSPARPLPFLSLDILLLIGTHVHAIRDYITLSRLTRTCHTLHTLLSPLLRQHFHATTAVLTQYPYDKPTTQRRLSAQLPCPAIRYKLLVYAAAHGCMEEVAALLKHETLAWNLGYGRYSPLGMAIAGGHVEVVRLLVGNGALVRRVEGRDVDRSARGAEVRRVLEEVGGEVQSDGAVVVSRVLDWSAIPPRDTGEIMAWDGKPRRCRFHRWNAGS